MKNEAQLQAAIVRAFGEERPNERGLLWATRQTTFNKKDGGVQRAMGMVKGVSDLVYFKGNRLICIELKLKGKRHKRDHILSQINWGERMRREGAFYYIVTSVDGFWLAITYDLKFSHPDVYPIDRCLDLLQETKGNTITFL